MLKGDRFAAVLKSQSLRRWRPLPGLLEEQPTGDVEIAVPRSSAAEAESLRDLARALQGGGVYFLSGGELWQSPGLSGPMGDVNQQAGSDARRSLTSSLGKELQRYSMASNLDALDALALRVAANCSVGPGLTVAMHAGIAPAVWQPLFVICIGGAQVRVLTYAFIGEPVTGDRPDRKHTPFVLRLATANLAAVSPADEAFAVRYTADYAARGVDSSLCHVLALKEELAAIVASGGWRGAGFEPPAVSPTGRREQRWSVMAQASSVVDLVGRARARTSLVELGDPSEASPPELERASPDAAPPQTHLWDAKLADGSWTAFHTLAEGRAGTREEVLFNGAASTVEFLSSTEAVVRSAGSEFVARRRWSGTSCGGALRLSHACSPFGIMQFGLPSEVRLSSSPVPSRLSAAPLQRLSGFLSEDSRLSSVESSFGIRRATSVYASTGRGTPEERTSESSFGIQRVTSEYTSC